MSRVESHAAIDQHRSIPTLGGKGERENRTKGWSGAVSTGRGEREIPREEEAETEKDKTEEGKRVWVWGFGGYVPPTRRLGT